MVIPELAGRFTPDAHTFSSVANLLRASQWPTSSALRWAKTRILTTDTRVSKRERLKTLACRKNVGGFFKHW